MKKDRRISRRSIPRRTSGGDQVLGLFCVAHASAGTVPPWNRSRTSGMPAWPPPAPSTLELSASRKEVLGHFRTGPQRRKSCSEPACRFLLIHRKFQLQVQAPQSQPQTGATPASAPVPHGQRGPSRTTPPAIRKRLHAGTRCAPSFSPPQDSFRRPASISGPPSLSFFSIAGGVGKTCLVSTLGRALSALGEHVLIADTAAGGVLPFYFGAREEAGCGPHLLSSPPLVRGM